MPSELRYAFRQLTKSPGFTLVAVIGLALGIGANAALFSVVNSVFLRPLPYHEPERLVRLASTDEAKDITQFPLSYPRFLAVQKQQGVFSALALSSGNAFTLTGRGDPEQLQALQASATLLPTLGLLPAAGRNFSAEEDRPGGANVALISQRLWQRHFNGDASALGQTLSLDGVPHTIVGVLPAAATAPPLDQIQLWVPRPPELPFIVPSQLNGGGYFFNVVGRLAPGVSLEQAQEAMKLTAEAYRSEFPTNVDAPTRIELIPLLEDAVAGARQSYLLLFGAVGCVLLVACANISNLLLARFAARRKEIAARFVLGASRRDVIRTLLTESLSVAILGGAVGLLMAMWALRAVVTLGADLIPRAQEISLDPLAIVFTIAVTLFTGLAIGLLPALQASSLHVREALNESSRGSTGTGRRLRGALLVSEVALSLVLLIAAGLLLTSFARLQRVEPGFQPEGIFTGQLLLPPQRYAGPALVAVYQRLYERISAIPGITSAALSDRVPLTGGTTPAPVTLQSNPVPLNDRPFANRHLISPRYFETLGIPIRAGRDFDERDSSTVPHVVIINETFARQFFAGKDPIGQTLITGMGQLPSRVIGVVADVRGQNLNTPPAADYFLPALQRPDSFTNILVRAIGDPAAMAPAVREALKEIDPNLPLLQPEPLTTRVAETVEDRKLALVLLGGFAGLALVLALLGVYSVMAHLVAYRTAEIGIRMALGASRGSVLRMVLGHGRRLTLLGIALGVAGAIGVTRLLQQALFEVNPTEPLIYAAVSALLLLVAEAACWFPAWRATRIDPAIAMRME